MTTQGCIHLEGKRFGIPFVCSTPTHDIHLALNQLIITFFDRGKTLWKRTLCTEKKKKIERFRQKLFHIKTCGILVKELPDKWWQFIANKSKYLNNVIYLLKFKVDKQKRKLSLT